MEKNSNNKNSSGAKTWFIIGVAAIALIAAAGMAAFLLLGEKMTPREIAEAYVNEEIGRVSEELAGWIGVQHVVLENVDGDWVQEKIHEHVRWTFSDGEWVIGDRYNVEAVAAARFGIDTPLIGTAWIGVTLPYDVIVDQRQQAVLGMNPRYTDASWQSDPALPDIGMLDLLGVPGVDDLAEKAIEMAADEAMEEVEEALDDAMEDVEEAIDEAEEAVDDAVEDAMDKVDDAADAAKDALDNLPGIGR